MAAKPLITHAELLKALDYDPATGIFRWKHRADRARNWNTRWAGKIAGGSNKGGHWRIAIGKERYMAHRLAWFYMTGKWPDDEIDHKKGNRSDNRFDELRDATQSQNAMNSKRRADNTSGIKGVSWDKSRGKWHAYANKDGRRSHIGRFDTIEEAAAARRKVADKLHGEFARHG